MNNKNVIAFDIGGTGCQWKIFESGKEVSQGEFSTQNKNKDDVIKEIASIIDGTSEDTLVGISSPTAINTETGYAYGESGIKGYANFNLYDALRKELKSDRNIKACNDGNAALLASLAFSDKKYTNAIMMTLGTGVGGALYINGELLFGRNGFCGETGYANIFMNGLNVSRNISTGALVRHINEKYSVEMNGKQIWDEYKKGEYKEDVDAWLDKITAIMTTQIFILNPDVFYLGGGISKNDEFMEVITNKVREVLKNDGVEKIMPDISKAYEGGSAGIYGAVELWNK